MKLVNDGRKEEVVLHTWTFFDGYANIITIPNVTIFAVAPIDAFNIFDWTIGFQCQIGACIVTRTAARGVLVRTSAFHYK